jgi:regulator of extracellular matrix RemA (YlzA/DUF370 family)
MLLIGIGFGSFIAAEKIVAVLAPDSAPIKRVIADARDRGLLIDASFGRSTRSVLQMNSNHVILSSLSPDEILKDLRDNQSEYGGNQS